MAEELIFSPAKRKKIGLLIGMSGPSGAGKTVSALRLTRGLVGPAGKIALLDTENGRALIDADDYEFNHGQLTEPFSPDRYVAAAFAAKNSGHDALIIDSMSHEWAGPGGVLDWHEKELDRLTKGSTDYSYRESMSMPAWAKPQTAHKAMVQRLLQMNFHVVFCFRAEEKIKVQLLPNKAGKLVNTPVPQGFQPIAHKGFKFELTIFLGFDEERPGVPIPIKLGDKFRPGVPLDRVLDEETGARLAVWARGDKMPAVSGSVENREKQRGSVAGASKKATVAETIAALTARFEAVTTHAEHLAIVDDPENHNRISWLKKNHPEAAAPLSAAIIASWERGMVAGRLPQDDETDPSLASRGEAEKPAEPSLAADEPPPEADQVAPPLETATA